MSVGDLEPREVDRLQRLMKDYPYFSKEVLKIRTKSGVILPFTLNKAQQYLHHRLEQQRQTLGRVRAIIVKGRQLGSSTYVQGRYYHRLWRSRRALRAFILTHHQDATNNLFGMAQRFHALHAPGLAQPPLLRGNAKELLFEDNDCGYAVSTAGSVATGRGSTFQLFHGSEVAFWENATEHVTGAFQTVGNAEGSEIILESTANGVGNMFYRQAQAAIRGESEFEAIFIPWFWGEDYVADCPDQWEPAQAWYEYARVHRLTWEQLYWAYLKNRELALVISASFDEPCWLFRQEFPATFDEAFQSSGNSFIPPLHVLRARKAKVIGHGPIILGVDPSRVQDRVGIIDRCGRRMGERIAERMDPGGSGTYVAAQIAARINRIRPDWVCVDVGGLGGPIFDILTDMGYTNLIAVNFGASPVTTSQTGDDAYFNRRAEMYDLLRRWLADDELPVQVPDDDSFQADICAAEWGPGKTQFNTSNELVLEEKDSIKKRIGASPDLGDAAALTFAMPYWPTATAGAQPRAPRVKNRRTGY